MDAGDRSKQFEEIDDDLRRIGSDSKYIPPCPYGSKCYRKNPAHLNDYRHDFSAKKSSKQSSKSKCDLPIKNKLITSYFGNKSSTTQECDSDSSLDSKSPVVDFSEKKGKRKRVKEDRKSEKRSRKTKTNDLNDLNKLMPNIGHILSKPDNLQPNGPLDIISSSSDSSQETTPFKEKLKTEKTNEEWNHLIRQLFLVQMPDDFFKFWQFCTELNPSNPQNALLKDLGLKLAGPFDVLNGTLDETNIGDEEKNLTNSRFYYDTPELQTVIVSSGDSKYHLGYFRDTPDEIRPVVVSNDPDKSCEITGVADNLFAAILAEISKQKCRKALLENLENKLRTFAKCNEIEVKKCTVLLRKRKKLVNAETFHKFGIVIKVVNDVGYRELPETDDDLRKMLKKLTDLDCDETRRKHPVMAEIHRIMTLINYANDEKDFGMGLEFGTDLFCTGHLFFHRSSGRLLENAYELLGRNEFGRIIKAHLKCRQR